MKRIWSVQEQVHVDNASGLTFTFTSEPTELDDTVVKLVVDSGSGRRLTIDFERNGLVTGADVTTGPVTNPAALASHPPEPQDGPPAIGGAPSGGADDGGLAQPIQL
jgi:hypothetical protein